MGLNITTGQVARGEENFFVRKEIVDDFWEKIRRGNILISAPRRVGKSSILSYIEENPIDNYNSIYVITESVKEENDFFKRIVEEMRKTFYKLQHKTSVVKDKITQLFNKVEISINECSIKYNKSSEDEIDYYMCLKNLIEKLDMDFNIIIMIDEFAQAVQNIKKYKSEESAVQFLEKNRELRQKFLAKKIYFVYAGSIGLENIASQMGCSSTINDLDILEIKPFDRLQGKHFTKELIENLETNFPNEIIDYILDKIDFLVPFFIQIIVNETDNICRHEGVKKVTNDFVDKAIDNIINSRNIYFVHWKDRLNTSFNDKNEVNFAIKILNILSKNKEVDFLEIKRVSEDEGLSNKLGDIINLLKYEGYIMNVIDSEDKYAFISPILKKWWFEHVAKYN
ncbi:UNVERIFIED_CONTAM: hypothetical protein Cloal_3164 [Acetivibrio alkalicellulosi]